MCAMYRQLLLIAVFCLFFPIILSIRCYTGTDRQCILTSNMSDCGSTEPCQCVKYLFQCTQDDQACTKHERLNNIKKWAYTILPANICRVLKTSSNGYEQVTCCSKSRCNQPDSGKCSRSQDRRRALRRLNDLLDF